MNARESISVSENFFILVEFTPISKRFSSFPSWQFENQAAVRGAPSPVPKPQSFRVCVRRLERHSEKVGKVALREAAGEDCRYLSHATTEFSASEGAQPAN
jgi:hypothetical protein